VEADFRRTFSVLHAFLNSTDGEDPNSLAIDSSGNFYGTAGSGALISGNDVEGNLRRHLQCAPRFSPTPPT